MTIIISEDNEPCATPLDDRQPILTTISVDGASQQGLEATQDEGLKLVEEQQPIEILIALLMIKG